QHITELHLKNKSNNNSNITSSESEQQEIMNNLSMGLGKINDGDDIFDSIDDDIEAIVMDADCETDILNSASFFDSINTDESIPELLLMIKRSYMLFILKLREEYLLPQGVTNIISTYIVTLIRHLEILLNKKAVLPSAYIYSSSTSS
ncbi:unnamed protein product, partial [Adineta steineri]